MEAGCCKYLMNAMPMYCAMRNLEQGPKELCELISKCQLLGMQKRVEEFNWVLRLISCHTPRRSRELYGLAERSVEIFNRIMSIRHA